MSRVFLGVFECLLAERPVSIVFDFETHLRYTTDIIPHISSVNPNNKEYEKQYISCNLIY